MIPKLFTAHRVSENPREIAARNILAMNEAICLALASAQYPGSLCIGAYLLSLVLQLVWRIFDVESRHL
jgi:hypothetical protein